MSRSDEDCGLSQQQRFEFLRLQWDSSRCPRHVRDLSLFYDRIGDVPVAQSNRTEELKSFRDGLAIRDRLGKADPANASWQRELSVSYNMTGDVQVAQGNLPEALKSTGDQPIDMAISLAAPIASGRFRVFSILLLALVRPDPAL